MNAQAEIQKSPPNAQSRHSPIHPDSDWWVSSIYTRIVPRVKGRNSEDRPFMAAAGEAVTQMMGKLSLTWPFPAQHLLFYM